MELPDKQNIQHNVGSAGQHRTQHRKAGCAIVAHIYIVEGFKAVKRRKQKYIPQVVLRHGLEGSPGAQNAADLAIEDQSRNHDCQGQRQQSSYRSAIILSCQLGVSLTHMVRKQIGRTEGEEITQRVQQPRYRHHHIQRRQAGLTDFHSNANGINQIISGNQKR